MPAGGLAVIGEPVVVDKPVDGCQVYVTAPAAPIESGTSPMHIAELGLINRVGRECSAMILTAAVVLLLPASVIVTV